MAVLIENSADHGRSERTVRERPIRNGEAGIVGRDQRPGDEQEKRAHGGEDGEPVDEGSTASPKDSSTKTPAAQATPKTPRRPRTAAPKKETK